MSTVPAEIAGVGSTAQRLRVSPAFDPLKAGIGPDEYFVLSRIDGVQSLREVLLTIGLPVERGVEIVARLRALGALLLPGEATPVAPPVTPPAPAVARAPTPTSASAASSTASTSSSAARRARPPEGTPPGAPAPEPLHDLSLPGATAEELAALAEPADLGDTERRRILAMARLAHGRDPHALLGVTAAADARTLKLAYFRLSKEVHPDRYYGKQLGSFTARLVAVFEATSRAYAQLTAAGKPRRAGRAASPAAPSVASQPPQTPQEYGAELFDRACDVEVGGDPLGAMKLFAAAVRVDPQLRYLRRAASCALAAGQPRTALEYAKKAHGSAPHDPSSARLLASAFRAAGKLADAEEVLVMAMAIKSENDTLASELRNDLAEVRRLLTSAPSLG